MKFNKNTYNIQQLEESLREQGYPEEAIADHPARRKFDEETGLLEGIKPAAKRETRTRMGHASLTEIELTTRYSSTPRESYEPVLNSRGEILLPNERESVIDSRR